MHNAMWKNPGSSCYMLYDSIYMTFWKYQNIRDWKEIRVCQELWLRVRNWLQMDMGIFWWWKYAVSWSWGWLYNCMCLSIFINLYTEKGAFYCCVNYSSINLTLKRKKDIWIKNILFLLCTVPRGPCNIEHRYLQTGKN